MLCLAAYLLALIAWHLLTAKREKKHVSLAEYLSYHTPYREEELQEMINDIKVIAGFDRSNIDAECIWKVRYNAMRCAIYAMQNTLSISDVHSRSIIYLMTYESTFKNEYND